MTSEFPYGFPSWKSYYRMASSHRLKRRHQMKMLQASHMHSKGISVHAMIYDQQRCKLASMEAVFVSVDVVLVVQVQAKAKSCASFAECRFLRFCNGVFPAALMHLCCARGISVCLHPHE
ncbi:hypothetical protein EJB05_42181, partial [Eragrostis curvula]